MRETVNPSQLLCLHLKAKRTVNRVVSKHPPFDLELDAVHQHSRSEVFPASTQKRPINQPFRGKDIVILSFRIQNNYIFSE